MSSLRATTIDAFFAFFTDLPTKNSNLDGEAFRGARKPSVGPRVQRQGSLPAMTRSGGFRMTGKWLVLPSAVAASLFAQEPALSPAERALAFAQLSPVPQRYLLADDTFPEFAFAEPEKARAVIGRHRLAVTFYGPDHRIAAKADRPGRYGAVIEIIPEGDGAAPPTRRFHSLFRLPEPAHMATLPKALAVRLRALRWSPGLALRGGFEMARELAGLHEVPDGTDPADFHQQSWEKERQWWITLKRSLYGFDRSHPAGSTGPREVEGPAAATLRPGSPTEAGVRDDAPRRLDELFTRWIADSNVGFDVCIARRGVVVLHKSYGLREGTKTALTSTSKMVTAAALMMLVDQGRLDLDRPVTELPGPLHGLKTARPVTLRALYTHTAFSVNIDPTADMEERVAQVLPHLPIGQGWQYTGTSLELAWALASQTTGESLSAFTRDRLFAPMGSSRTEVRNTGGSTTSTSMDMARFCQMLLNRGAYGNKRFLSEKMFAEMLPRRPVDTVSPFTNDRAWGIGTHYWKTPDLSALAFGHAGYFKSTVFVDPAHELVVVMLRQGAGTNYDKYHPQFIKLVSDSLIDRLPAFPAELTLADRDLPPGTDTFTVEALIDNPSSADAVLEYRYETAGSAWTIAPRSARIPLPAKATTPVRIAFRFDAARPSPLPMLHGAISFAAGPQPVRPIEYFVRPLIRRTMIARRLDRAPTIDGRIAAGEYGADDGAALRETHGRKEPSHATSFRVRFDDKALYVAVQAVEESPKSRVRAVAGDEAGVRKDDHVELIIDATRRGEEHRQFATGINGDRFDARQSDAKWNAEWTSAVGFDAGEYAMEFRIPFESLGVPAPRVGDKWSFNVRRVRGPRDPKWERFAEWVTTYADFDSKTHVGELTFE